MYWEFYWECYWERYWEYYWECYWVPHWLGLLRLPWLGLARLGLALAWPGLGNSKNNNGGAKRRPRAAGGRIVVLAVAKARSRRPSRAMPSRGKASQARQGKYEADWKAFPQHLQVLPPKFPGFLINMGCCFGSQGPSNQSLMPSVSAGPQGWVRGSLDRVEALHCPPGIQKTK